MGVISNLLSGGAANIVKSVGDIADKYIRTKEEKDQFNLEVQKEIFSQSMQQQSMILENLKVAAADRDSARKLFAVNSSMQKILGYCAVFGFFVYAMFITYLYATGKEISSQGNLVIGIILGYLGGFATMPYVFSFGSSAGSQQKNMNFNDLIKKIGDPNNNPTQE